MEKALAVFKGTSGSAELFSDRVVVKKSLAFGNRQKTIFLSQLSGVIVKNIGWTSPAIHFATANSEMKKATDNKNDDSTILIGPLGSQKAQQFKEQVERQMALVLNKGTPTLSGADEIVKYKALLDEGVISPEEFEAKKKQLLGL